MKNLGKLMATILLIAAILMTMCLPAMAETAKVPSAQDSATVTITNLTGTPTVKLYQIVKAKYDTTGFAGYESAIPAENQAQYPIANPESPTFDEIEKIWLAVKQGNLTLTEAEATVSGTEATATVAAGTWLAVLTNTDTTIYNPIVVSASYKAEDGTPLVGGSANAGEKWTLDGGKAVAKSSTPKVEKNVTGTKTENSVSVGDKLHYTISADLPSYSANAVNKTFYVSDTMSSGLTLLADSITVGGKAAVNNQFTNENGDVIAKLKVAGNTFKVVFDYEKLNGTVPTVEYDAVVNDNAKAGNAGNTNDADLIYANDPSKGKTWKDPEDPDEPDPTDPDSGVKKTTSTVTVYTYQLAFKKTGTGDDAEKLAGAKFGIYSDAECKNLVDVVTTNAEGYAVSSKVAEGTYYVKELEAPNGYALNNKVYPITVKATTAKTETTETVREYTTEQKDGAEQVGWLKGGVFYGMNVEHPEDSNPAYIDSENETRHSETVTAGTTEGAGTVLSTDVIPNTKVSELPSTGGMGTTLFVVGGVAVMALAVVLIVANKRRAESK